MVPGFEQIGNRLVKHIPNRNGFEFQVFSYPCVEWDRCEQELVAGGMALPLRHRIAWARAHASEATWFVAVRDTEGKCNFGFAVELAPSRVLPWHVILRVQKFGSCLEVPARNAGLAGLAHLARSARRTLRVHLEVFSPQAEVRAQIGGAAQALGFRRADSARGYTDTIAIDLTAEESEIFASFHRKTRRDIRRIGREPFEVRPIARTEYIDRMNRLLAETMRRTGGISTKHDWKGRIGLSDRHPSLSRLVGLFQTDVSTVDSLVAFCWACANGDHVEYSASASTRIAGSNLPLTYALVWDIIRWGKSVGATWFDFGGVTWGGSGSRDPLGGISDFKRFFSKRVVRVGEEWVLEPNPVRAAIANVVSAGAEGVRRVREGLRKGRSSPAIT